MSPKGKKSKNLTIKFPCSKNFQNILFPKNKSPVASNGGSYAVRQYKACANTRKCFGLRARNFTAKNKKVFSYTTKPHCLLE